MKRRIKKGLILASSLALWLAAAAQDETREDEAPAADSATGTQEHGEMLDPSAAADDSGESRPPGETDPPADLESGEAAEGQRDTSATMERFRPTEKISEDRSVAFPNDI